MIDKGVKFEAVEKVAVKTVKKLLKSVGLFDVFEDEQKVGAGKKSYAVSFVFQHEERTLTDKEIEKVMQQLSGNYERELGAQIRE